MSFYFENNDSRKRQFVAFRTDATFFDTLKQESERRGLDISNTIRELCKEGLK